MLRIRFKLIIIIGILFTSLTSILGFIVLQYGKQALNKRLTEMCHMSLQHASFAIKDDLLSYYRFREDTNGGSLPLGHIREEILKIFNENITGLVSASVVDREGVILAHNESDYINQHITLADSILYNSLSETFTRENEDIIEYIYPIFSKSETISNGRLYLGTTILGFSKKEVLQPIKSATHMIVTVTGLIILISVIIIFIIAHRMTVQIDALSDGVRRVDRGNLEDPIPILTNDELGELAKEFNNMTRHLSEKLQMQKFVSKLTVQMIRKRSSTKDLPPIGENRTVTLLFSDVRNFSAITEKLSPEEIVKLVNIYLDLQARIVEENGGIVDKFMGDQIMAIFIGDSQADDAIRTAVEIQRSIRELNIRRKRKELVYFTVGCGLNIGDAVMGNMGSKNRLDYTVIGDVVNLASHLCAIAKPSQIIAPIDIIKYLNGEYPTVRLNPISVKGKSLPVDVIEVDYDRAIIM